MTANSLPHASLGRAKRGVRVVVLAFVSGLSACAPPPAPAAPSAPGPSVGELDRTSAMRLLAELVAADRARAGLPLVAWDEAAASAAQAHVDDMTRNGFAAHIGTDGSVPEERATRAGVGHAVMENIGCIADARPRALETAPRFSRGEIEAIHRAFMDEAPPFDGHRRNVLGPWHGAIGVGLARAVGVARPCVAVLLVAREGKLDPLPREAVLGDLLLVSGIVAPPNAAAYVSAARLPARGPQAPADLNQTGSYAPPRPYIAVEVERDPSAPGAFKARVPLDDHRTAGTYAVGVWARLAGATEPILIALRTVAVR